jgi:hypothetical protein
MIELTNIRARFIKINNIEISWQITPTTEDISPYRIVVYRSFSPEGPFSRVSDPITANTILFIDKDRITGSRWRKIYYQLTVENIVTGESEAYAVVGLEPERNLHLLEIIRRNDLYLQRYIGIPSAIKIKKTWGQRCDCYDERLHRKTNSSCKKCFNTGFVDGYFDQIHAYVNYSPSQEAVQIAEWTQQPNSVSCWLSNYPLVSPGDIFIDFKTHTRWRVANKARTGIQLATSRQICQIVEINRSDIEWDIPFTDWSGVDDVFLGFYAPYGSGLL